MRWPDPLPEPEVQPSEPWARELFPRAHLSARFEHEKVEEEEEAGDDAS